VREILKEDSEDEKNNEKFEKHRKNIKKDYKGLIQIMKEYFIQLQNDYRLEGRDNKERKEKLS
jgi:hypothetical protein